MPHKFNAVQINAVSNCARTVANHGHHGTRAPMYVVACDIPRYQTLRRIVLRGDGFAMFQKQTLRSLTEGTKDGSHRVWFLLYNQLHRGNRLSRNSIFLLPGRDVGGDLHTDGNIVHSLEYSQLGAGSDGPGTGVFLNGLRIVMWFFFFFFPRTSGWGVGPCYQVFVFSSQALETFNEEQKQDKKYAAEDRPQSALLTPHTEHPRYEILLSRKFEMTELCHIFFNRWVKYLYLIIMSVYSFLAGWSYSTVAGSAWSTNLPFHTGAFNQCSDTQFYQSVAPSDPGCLASYRLCVLFFAVIVVPLSCMDLKEQGFVQMVLGLLRFSIIISMVLYCLANLIRGDSSPQSGNNATSITAYPSSFEWSLDSNQSGGCNSSASDADFVTSFHIKGWLIAIPVFTYAQILHQGVPALTHPIRQKKLLRWFMMAVFATTSLCYMVLGIMVSLWFKSAVYETATLNWVSKCVCVCVCVCVCILLDTVYLFNVLVLSSVRPSLSSHTLPPVYLMLCYLGAFVTFSLHTHRESSYTLILFPSEYCHTSSSSSHPWTCALPIPWWSTPLSTICILSSWGETPHRRCTHTSGRSSWP